MLNTSKGFRFIIVLAAVLAAFALVLAACNGDDDDVVPPPNGEPNDVVNGDEVTFDISMGDNFFEPDEFTVAPGTTITFNITNDGAAVHNMRVAGADNVYNTDDDVVSDPEMFTAGDTGTLVWTVPDEPGVYDFHCDFHPTEQVGTITVQ
jgi:plastocyanin